MRGKVIGERITDDINLTWSNFLETVRNMSEKYREGPIADSEIAQTDAVHCARAYLDYLRCQKNEISQNLVKALVINTSLASKHDDWRPLGMFLALIGEDIRDEGDDQLEVAGEIIENITKSVLGNIG